MRDDLVHFAFGLIAVAIAIAIGLLFDWSDQALGVAILVGIGVSLVATDALLPRITGPGHRRRARRRSRVPAGT